jgi:YaiO family outer membrane protein
MSRAVAALVLAAGLLAPASAAAEESAGEATAGRDAAVRNQRPATEVEAGFSHENLSSGYDDWRSVYLEGARHFAPGKTLYGMVRETKRFGLRDLQATAGLYHPAGEHWTALVEASSAPQHRVLPRYSVFAQMRRALPAGWGAALGYRYSEYNDTRASTLVVDLERYFGSFRGAYTLYLGHTPDAPTVAAHRFLLAYYYGERNSVGASFTFGEEVANLGPPTGVTTTDVRTFALFGRHWLNAAWAISYELVQQEQGNLYRYNGIRLGLRHRF